MATSAASSPAKIVPFVKGHPLLGSYQDFLRDRPNFITHLGQQGDVVGFRIGPVPMLFFNRAEHVQYILVEHANDFSKGRLMRRAVGNNGLVVSEGDFYRKQRKLMAPPFQPRHIASYADTMVSYANRVVQEWSDGAVIDLNHTMIRTTMSIIGKVLFGTEFLSEADELGAAINTGLAHAVRTLTSPLTCLSAFPRLITCACVRQHTC